MLNLFASLKVLFMQLKFFRWGNYSIINYLIIQLFNYLILQLASEMWAVASSWSNRVHRVQ